MKLFVATPTAIVADIDGVEHVRAEDGTGAFGIAPGHADFLTLLPVSVVTWRNRAGDEAFVLIRGGVLTVHGGDLVEIAARGAYREEDLAALGDTALEQLRKADESEDVTRTSDTRLHLATLRQIERLLQAGYAGRGGPPVLHGRSAGRGAP